VVERLSELEKWRIAELGAQGLPLRLIAKDVGRAHSAVRSNLQTMLRPAVPERTRSPLRLSLTEREEISRGLAGGESRRSIARRLGRSPSTISREVNVNGGVRRYRACRADSDAVRRARRPKAAKLAVCGRLRAAVEARLEVRWSPAQISGWLVEEFPDDPEMRVSHETIDVSLFVQSRGAEHMTRFVMLIALPNGHAADVVADALATKIVELPEQLRRSLTWDQGKEMAAHAQFSVQTGVPVYFCDPGVPGSAAATRTPTGC